MGNIDGRCLAMQADDHKASMVTTYEEGGHQDTQYFEFDSSPRVWQIRLLEDKQRASCAYARINAKFMFVGTYGQTKKSYDGGPKRSQYSHDINKE